MVATLMRRFPEPTAITIDAVAVAPHLGLSPSRFMAELRRGLIYQATELGVGKDESRYRVTFRYRARECRVVVGPDGITAITGRAAVADRAGGVIQ